ncbi:peroxisomal membrane protein pex14 [Entomortierella chlamydospora]|uniref:Peroxisomal membrane protein PEX14 n=1 Tax=Entomortierella chlamydospora TaxID=101097 RepID=A0A9P6MFX2_9FUNG|nr:peroxisomal membrane protein pex14 [Entomortierella chlamydospora]KAG0001908.1 peroxisomal membrane protein pex14 [Entomortierella chlamydospora]
MSGMREDILASAVKFLQDPKVQASPLGKKVAFLESKGLTSQEIEEAMARANGTSTGAATTVAAAGTTPGTVQQMAVPYQGQGQVVMAPSPPPPLPAKYDWKDMFIAAVVAGGFSYGMWQIAKRVIGPKLQWPSQEDLELDKKKLDEQFEEIEKSLAEVKTSTTVVAKSVDDQTSHVKESLESMSGVLEGMKNNNDKREQELVGLKTDIENIKDMIPKLIEKNKESQANTLNDLQSEIKSLKSLLMSRRPGPTGPSTPGGSTPTTPWASVPAGYGSLQNNTSISSASASTATPTPASSDLAMNFLNTRTSIPSWQLATNQSAAPAKADSTLEEGSETANNA